MSRLPDSALPAPSAPPFLPFSVLDLAPIAEGSDAREAIERSVALAQHCEALGYHRYWLAEHHNMDGLACSATVVLIAHLAAATRRIRLGSGGIMLPNHAPLVVAEQFGTLATVHPGRIDLGLGRAPGTDGPTMRALRRTLASAGEDDFARDVLELQAYLARPGDPASTGHAPAGVRALPGQGTEVPIWLLGSSTYGAQLAAHLGLPFAFASHFAPDLLRPALELYRRGWRASARWPRPHAMVAVNVVAAPTDDEAAFLFTSLQQRFLGMRRGQRGPLPAPVPRETMDALWSPEERAGVAQMLSVSAVGGPDTIAERLAAIAISTGAQELILAGAIHDPAARERSYALAMKVRPGVMERVRAARRGQEDAAGAVHRPAA